MDAKGYLETPHILLVSQKVKDIKVAPNGELEHRMGVLRQFLRTHSFIPGDKVPATVTPRRIVDGILVADITGKFLSSDLDTGVHITQRFPLSLTNYDGPLDVEAVFSRTPGAEIDDGGNIQNMIVNLGIGLVFAKQHKLMEHKNLKITIASSSDPFANLPENLACQLRAVCNTYLLDLPDRFAIQVPWRDEDQHGTLAITSEPQRVGAYLEKLILENHNFCRLFGKCTCFVSADPIYDQLKTYAKPPYSEVINASTAFRSLTAAEAYSRTVLLPMNNGEAGDVCKLLLQRVYEEELSEIERLPFPSPLAASNERIDPEALRELDKSLEMFTRYIPVRHKSFTCPISFGPDGGLIIGSGSDTLVCFTSTPSMEGEELLLAEFGDPRTVVRDRKYEVGAGDAVATVVTLFNALSPRDLLVGHMQGREPEDHDLVELASTIFVSLLGRVVGSFLLHTKQTYWSNLSGQQFPRLLDETAKTSLDVARSVLRKLYAPTIADVKKWGISVVVWKLGRVAYPEHTPPDEVAEVPV